MKNSIPYESLLEYIIGGMYRYDNDSCYFYIYSQEAPTKGDCIIVEGVPYEVICVSPEISTEEEVSYTKIELIRMNEELR